MKIAFEKRPTCTCGVKMKLFEYKGYYDGFKYWGCDNCKQDDELDNFEADTTWRGGYA